MEGAGRGALLGRWFLFWVAQTSTWAKVSRLPVYFVAHTGNGGGGHETDAEHERRRLPRWLLAGGSPESSCGQWFPDPRAWGERGERGGSVPVTPGMGDRVEGGPPRAAMATAMGARGELGSGRGRERHELGEVDEVMEMLTSKGIAPRWTGGGDRSEGMLLGEKQRSGKLEQRGRRVVELRSSACLVVARRARGGLFIGAGRRWRGGRWWPAGELLGSH